MDVFISVCMYACIYKCDTSKARWVPYYRHYFTKNVLVKNVSSKYFAFSNLSMELDKCILKMKYDDSIYAMIM